MSPSELPLRDIHVPDPVGWWPPAIGWWLFAGIVALMVVLAVLRWRHRRTVAYRFGREIARLRSRYLQDGDNRRLFREGSVMLRRACMSAFPRDQVAGLAGAEWLEFLGQVLEDDELAATQGEILRCAPYQPQPGADADEFLALLDRVGGKLRESTGSGR